MFLPVVLLGLCCIGAASASCAQNLAQDSEYMTCVMGIAMLMQDQSQDAMTTMCSPRGQKKMECFFQYAKTCPDLLSPQSGGGGDGMSAMLGQLGSMKQMCSMVSGPCSSQVQACVPSQPPAVDMPQGGASTPFSMFPKMTENVCGPMKATFDCLEGQRAQCPTQVSMIEESMQSMFDESSSSTSVGQPVLNYGLIQQYMSSECPKVPAGYATNSCVKQKLESRKFQECYAKLMQDFSGQLNSCPAYFAGKTCVEESVGSCGRAEARSLIKSAPVFLTGIPSNCEGDMDDTGDMGGMGGGSADAESPSNPDGGKGGMGSPEPSDGAPASGNDGNGNTGGSGGIYASVITLIVASASLIVLFY